MYVCVCGWGCSVFELGSLILCQGGWTLWCCCSSVCGYVRSFVHTMNVYFLDFLSLLSFLFLEFQCSCVCTYFTFFFLAFLCFGVLCCDLVFLFCFCFLGLARSSVRPLVWLAVLWCFAKLVRSMQRDRLFDMRLQDRAQALSEAFPH